MASFIDLKSLENKDYHINIDHIIFIESYGEGAHAQVTTDNRIGISCFISEDTYRAVKDKIRMAIKGL